MFADAPFRRELHLSAVNSINWARIAAQIPYYVAAALALGAPDREVAFAVPTGNFGNVLAAWAARRMGLPVARLVVGSQPQRHPVPASWPATTCRSAASSRACRRRMDIQVSSNFERLLFELLDRDAAPPPPPWPISAPAGRMPVPEAAWRRAIGACSTASASTTTARWRKSAACTRPRGYLADPHSAIGIGGGAGAAPAVACPSIAMATAHPAKFPDAMERAIGIRPALPPRLADLYEREEHYQRAPNDLAAIEALVRAIVLRNAA